MCVLCENLFPLSIGVLDIAHLIMLLETVGLWMLVLNQLVKVIRDVFLKDVCVCLSTTLTLFASSTLVVRSMLLIVVCLCV